MANIKDLNQKIASLQNMQKVTRAMNLIASTRLYKLFQIQSSLKDFSSAIEKIAEDMSTRLDTDVHPALGGYRKQKRIHAVLFTSDKGMCGAHNNSVHRALATFIEKRLENGTDTEVTCFGAKGRAFSRRRGYNIVDEGVINEKSMSLKKLRETAAKLFSRFTTAKVQEVYLIFNRYISTLQQETVLTKVLPLSPSSGQADQSKKSAAITEPGAEHFVESAAELYLYYSLTVALYNSYLSEYASRMTAMENATNNSEDLIDRYMTLQNRVRQGEITNEIIEIVSGKEAMKG